MSLLENVPHLILFHSFIRFITEYALRQVQTPSPNRVLHTIQFRASSFNLQYLVVTLKSSSSCLRLFPCLSVTSILPSIFSSTKWFWRQFLHKTWSIQLCFLLVIVRRQFLFSWTLCNTSSFLTWSVQLIFSILLQHHMSKHLKKIWSIFQNIHV